MTALLGFTGDVFLGSQEPTDLFASVRPSLPRSTKLVVNFEGTLYTDASTLAPARRKILLTSSIDLAKALERLPTLAVCVGNNHIGDYGNGIAGVTIQHLAQEHPVFGAGIEGQPSNTLLVQHNGVVLGFASYCDNDTSPLHATADRVGPQPLTQQLAESDLDRLRGEARHCVALLHWGDEDYHCPRPDQVARARSLIDAGYSVVIGSHSHTAQGYERYRHGWIFYSLGNFYFPDHRVTIDGTEYGVQWMRRRAWGLLPLFRVTSESIELSHVLVTTHRRNEPPRVKSATLRRLQLRAYSLLLASPAFARVSQIIRGLEAFVVRVEEFANNPQKGHALLRKAQGLIGVSGAEPSR